MLLTMQREVGTCYYLLHRLIGPQCPLVWSLQLQVVNALNKGFSSFFLYMETRHRCTAFTYDVSCIIGDYLNACMKALATVSLSDPGRRILVSFQYLKDELRHIRYVGFPLTPSLGSLLLTRDTQRVVEARQI